MEAPHTAKSIATHLQNHNDSIGDWLAENWALVTNLQLIRQFIDGDSEFKDKAESALFGIAQALDRGMQDLSDIVCESERFVMALGEDSKPTREKHRTVVPWPVPFSTA